MRRVVLILCVFILLCGVLCGCTQIKSKQSEKTITVTDALGRKIHIKTPVKKIVLLYGLEDYAAIGGNDSLRKLVGINAWRYKMYRPDWWQAWKEYHPEIAKLPDVGQPGKTFQVEEVIKLKPDVVIADRSMYKYMSEDIKKLGDAGIPVVFTDFFPHTDNVTKLFEEVNKSAVILGKILNRENRAQEVVKFFENHIKEVVEKTKNIKHRPKVVVFATWSKWRVYGKKGMYNFWIDLAGGENIAANVIPGFSGDINPEYVLKMNPDVIVFTCNNNFPSGQKVVIGYTVRNSTPAKEVLRSLISRQGWNDINAIKSKRVYIIHHGLSHGHLFEFVCLEYMAKWLHPEIFKNLNPSEDLRAFYSKFMPMPLHGVWAAGLGGG
ncbi:MAG: hypothetical protein DSY33_00745 [Archaeoglobus sp.]|nr:MAG: hypothetical protein DSY33_00745 [Archaeoglobus sp.]